MDNSLKLGQNISCSKTKLSYSIALCDFNIIFHISISIDFLSSALGSGHETVAVLLPGFAINW